MPHYRQSQDYQKRYLERKIRRYRARNGNMIGGAPNPFPRPRRNAVINNSFANQLFNGYRHFP